MTLNELGLKYGTDKASSGHDYLNRLEPFFFPFKYKARKIVEIGIAGGASLKVWEDYFPYAIIVGLDHNADFVEMTRSSGPRIIPQLHEARSERDWLKFTGATIDIIIDDGGHHAAQIIDAFKFAWKLLAPGGLYVVEDLHTAFNEQYNKEIDYATALQFFHRLMEKDLMENGAGETGKVLLPDTSIDFMHWTKSLLIIGKRK